MTATLVLVLLMTAALAVLSWSSLFERLYEPLAQVIVPMRNAIAAIPIAAGAAAGSFELLLFLPLMVVGPFFFLGLRFRVALTSVLLMLASFSIAAMVAGLAVPFVARAAVFLALCIVACAVSARHFDRGRFDYRVAYVVREPVVVLRELGAAAVPVVCLAGDRRTVWPWRLSSYEARLTASGGILSL